MESCVVISLTAFVGVAGRCNTCNDEHEAKAMGRGSWMSAEEEKFVTGFLRFSKETVGRLGSRFVGLVTPIRAFTPTP